jgi:hypothetical protein
LFIAVKIILKLKKNMLAKTKKNIKRVAFFGDGAATENQKHYKDAYKVAKLLAENGYVIVNGGGPGVMMAATLGAKAGGGKVEVVALDPKEEPGNYEGIERKNIKLADKKVLVRNYSARLNRLVKDADAFVIFKGGAGTLSEIGLTWELAKFNYGNHEPLIFYGSFWKKIIIGLFKGLNLEKIERQVVEVVDKPEDVVRVLAKVEN